MKVSTSKCLISVFLVMILCQAAVAAERFDLLPCTDGDSGGMLYCIEFDSVDEISYPHYNISRIMTIRLPLLVLTQLWLNQGEIVIVTPSGEAINNGQELTRSQDRDRWTIIFTFQRVNSDFGKLHLDFHIKDVTFVDEQILHLEIRTQDNIFVTGGKTWFPVHDLEGEAPTTDNPAEDPSAFLHARIETLQNEKEALQEEKMTAKNASIHYQTHYFHCLEANDDLSRNMKPDFYGKRQDQIHLNDLYVDIATLILVICTNGVVSIAFLLKGSKLAKSANYYKNKCIYIKCKDGQEYDEEQECNVQKRNDSLEEKSHGQESTASYSA